MKLLQMIVVIFTAAPAVTPQTATPHTASAAKDSTHDVYGTLRKVEGSRFTIETRTGKTIQVDATVAIEQGRMINFPTVGHAVDARGTYDAKGVLHADTILRWKDSPALWPLDH